MQVRMKIENSEFMKTIEMEASISIDFINA